MRLTKRFLSFSRNPIDDEESNIIFGAVIDDSLGEKIQITIIATGFEQQREVLKEQLGSEFAASRLMGDSPSLHVTDFSDTLVKEQAKVIKLGTNVKHLGARAVRGATAAGSRAQTVAGFDAT